MNAYMFCLLSALKFRRAPLVDGKSWRVKKTRLHSSSKNDFGSRLISRSASSSTAFFTSVFEGVGVLGRRQGVDAFYDNKNNMQVAI